MDAGTVLSMAHSTSDQGTQGIEFFSELLHLVFALVLLVLSLASTTFCQYLIRSAKRHG